MPPDETKPFAVELSFDVKTYEIDFAGIVSNIVYIRWLEDLRLAVMAAHYPVERALDEGLAPTVVETRIRYKRPVTLLDEPVGRMWVSEMKRARAVFHTEFRVGEEVTTVADQIVCFLDAASGYPRRMPEELYEKYQALQSS